MVKTSETVGNPEITKHRPQPNCQKLKMGFSNHSGSTQGVYAWKVVEAVTKEHTEGGQM